MTLPIPLQPAASVGLAEVNLLSRTEARRFH